MGRVELSLIPPLPHLLSNMTGKATGRLRQRAGYSSPSTQQHSQQRLKKFILLKKQAKITRNQSLSLSKLPNIDIPPMYRMLSFAKPTTLSISPTSTPAVCLPELLPTNTPYQELPKPTRPQAKARRRLPPPMCCVCWQPFTTKSPEFHFICGSIPCLDCLGYHTCPG